MEQMKQYMFDGVAVTHFVDVVWADSLADARVAAMEVMKDDAPFADGYEIDYIGEVDEDEEA